MTTQITSRLARRRSPFGAALILSLMASSAAAESIDYVAASISPAATFNGVSGNFNVTNGVQPGGEVRFQLTFSIVTNGNTTSFPRTVTFGASTDAKPAGGSDAVVLFGASGTSTTSCTFASAAGSCVVDVKIVVPSGPGAYSVKISARDGTGGRDGLERGGGIAVNFVVAQGCAAAATTLSMEPARACVVVGSRSVSFAAMLQSGGGGLSGKPVEFSLDGGYEGTWATDSTGAAVMNYDPSGLAVGDHGVAAGFQGEQCRYEASGTSATLGVTYAFLGFQPPVAIDGNGVGLFSGKVIPVKIRIADAQGRPVVDASPHVFFRAASADVTSELAADSVAATAPDAGNAMRYDAAADQYVFNWDVSRVENGFYAIRVGLDEGSCGEPHTATVNIQKKSGKK